MDLKQNFHRCQWTSLSKDLMIWSWIADTVEIILPWKNVNTVSDKWQRETCELKVNLFYIYMCVCAYTDIHEQQK